MEQNDSLEKQLDVSKGKGDLNRGTSIKDFATYVHDRYGTRGKTERRAARRLYWTLTNDLHKLDAEIATVGDFDRLRTKGWERSLGKIKGLGPSACELLNAALRDCGVEPIAWQPNVYGHRERRKEHYPVPHLTLDTPIDDFLAALLSEHHKQTPRISPVGSMALVEYVRRTPQIQTARDLYFQLRNDGGTQLQRVLPSPIRFRSKSTDSINKVVQTYGLPPLLRR